jgi:hypothetical protein
VERAVETKACMCYTYSNIPFEFLEFLLRLQDPIEIQNLVSKTIATAVEEIDIND